MLMRVLLIACVVACVAVPATTQVAPADETHNAVTYQGSVYLSLGVLVDLLDWGFELTELAQGIRVSAGGDEWEFTHGGARLRAPSGEERRLDRPLLVIDGKYFIPLDECAALFGYDVDTERSLRLLVGGKELAIVARNVDSQFQRYRVRDMRPVHRAVVTVDDVRARSSLIADRGFSVVEAGTTLLIRREVILDGSHYVVATDVGSSLQSYLVAEDELQGKVRRTALDGTAWDGYREWFRDQATKEAGLRLGNGQGLEKTVSLTVDLCWSLRPYEEEFFHSLPKMLPDPRGAVYPAIFVSGQWLQQHPLEMDRLIELGQEPLTELIWGLHSSEHPKTGGFMNDYAPEEVRADTLEVESLLLEWGIVPTVYYRFPGIIHDRIRLEEILELDLFPIDVDSWMAVVGTAHPYGHPVRDGSIVMVHGNGNEPEGIAVLSEWLQKHRDWVSRPLHQFFPDAR